jgi:hypothetical protein
MNTARKIIDDLAAIGATVRPDGDQLLLKAGASAVPADLVSRIKASKAELLQELVESEQAFEERAAIVEFDGGAPRPWAEALARLDPANPPGDVPLKNWLRFIDDAGRFLDAGWAAKAESLGWSALQVFGCDAVKPFARISRAGLIWALEGRKLEALIADKASIITPSGGRLSFYPKTIEPGGVLVWELDATK